MARVDLFMKDHYERVQARGRRRVRLHLATREMRGPIPSDAVTGVRHKVRVTDHETARRSRWTVPEGRYVLFEAEQDGWELPNACRMSCCTKCAVKVTSGTLKQPEALGLVRSTGTRATRCCACQPRRATWKCVTQDEEEVYQMQFGELFDKLATDKNAGSVLRDDFALEIADMDE